MDQRLTLVELTTRWEHALAATQDVVARNPNVYRELKSLITVVLTQSIDIDDYFPTVEKITLLLETLDPCDSGSIFQHFKPRVAPSKIWQVRMLRMECRDLLAHLKAFDKWRRSRHHLHMV